MPGAHSRDVRTAVAVLAAGAPHGVTWRYSQHVDISGDGVRDEVFTSKDQKRFYVGVVLGPIRVESRAGVASFSRDGDSQDRFCGKFESLSPEKLATREELIEIIGEEPDGYPFGTSGSGLRLLAGECDSFHLFWNTSANALKWWRL
jgi:hypothetical protein